MKKKNEEIFCLKINLVMGNFASHSNKKKCFSVLNQIMGERFFVLFVVVFASMRVGGSSPSSTL
jgi:hypothetical protein